MIEQDFDGAKITVLCGGQVLVYQRDDNLPIILQTSCS